MTSNTLVELAAVEARVKALRSKQRRVGPWRAAGIQLSINSLKQRQKALRARTQTEGDSE